MVHIVKGTVNALQAEDAQQMFLIIFTIDHLKIIHTCIQLFRFPNRCVKKLSANAGDIRDADSTPRLGRSPGRVHSNPLQCSYLENPMDRGAWWAIILKVANCQAELKQLCTHAYNFSVPGSGRAPGEGNGNRLQYPCLENPMDRGAWWATVHGVPKSRTQLSDCHTHMHTHTTFHWIKLQLCYHSVQEHEVARPFSYHYVTLIVGIYNVVFLFNWSIIGW